MFDPNDGFMYLVTALVIAIVIAQSVFFLLKAIKRAKQLNIQSDVIKKTISSSAIFTIAPAVAILLGVIALSKALGFPFPWLRLSIIGALTYETSAAATAASAVGFDLSNTITDPAAFADIAWVVTVGSVFAMLLVIFFTKKIENSLDKIKAKDTKWSDIFMTGLFLGMISAFLGVVFARVGEGLVGWTPVFVMLVSAIIMSICGIIYKKTKAAWVTDYALPISMLGAMALALPITNLVNSIAA